LKDLGLLTWLYSQHIWQTKLQPNSTATT